MSEKDQEELDKNGRRESDEEEKPSFRERLSSQWRFLVRAYATVDPRSLGVFRIGLGLLLFEDVARRYPDLVSFYTNLGWLTNHFALYRPMSNHLFSLHHAFSTPAEVHVIFALHLLVNFALLVGYKTKLSHFLAWFFITSLNSRNVMVENGGFVMLQLLVLYTWFLPLGQRFSVDSFLASWRARRETTVAELSERQPPPVAPVAHFAVTLVILQWAANYYLNTVQKNGPTWQDGSALHYFMHQGRLMRPFGFWLREQIPLEVSVFLTRTTLIVEGTIVVLWLTPYLTKSARMLAWILSIGLHVGITLFARLGPFSWVMMLAYALFIPAEVWEWLAERHRRTRRRVLCLLDESSPFALGVGRVIKRFDRIGAVRFSATQKKTRKSALSVGMKLEGRTEVAHGSVAVGRVAQALPIPRLGLWLLKGLGLQSLLGKLLDWGMAKRARFSRLLGLDVARPPPRLKPESRGRRLLGHVKAGLATVVLVGLLVIGVSQVLVENRIVPAWAKPARPEWVVATVVYPRLFQGWSMFAPDPPNEDGWMIVDGRTADGRKLDPLTGREPNFSMDLPGGPDFTPQWGAFHMRIHENRFSVYYNGVRDYLLRTHEISGNPENRLVAFDAWYLSRFVGTPRGDPGPVRYRKLFSYGRVRDSGLPSEAGEQVVDDRGQKRDASSVEPAGNPHRPPSAASSARPSPRVGARASLPTSSTGGLGRPRPAASAPAPTGLP